MKMSNEWMNMYSVFRFILVLGEINENIVESDLSDGVIFDDRRMFLTNPFENRKHLIERNVGRDTQLYHLVMLFLDRHMLERLLNEIENHFPMRIFGDSNENRVTIAESD